MELKIEERKILGKKVKNLRREGLIPGEVYGHNLENRHISFGEKNFLKIYKEAGENMVVYLITETGEKIPTIIAEAIHDPLTAKFIAVDFHEVKMDEKIETKVPIEFINEAPATKNGFVLLEVLHEIEVEALPSKIPHRIEVDLSSLENFGDSVRIENLKKIPDVKIITAGDTVIATITEAAKEEIPAAPPQDEATEQPVPQETENQTQENPESVK